MASDDAFMQYVTGQIAHAGIVTVRKMFGEYAVYVDGKTVGLICDNQFFLKPTASSIATLGDGTMGAPYPGAKPHFVIDEALEDVPFVTELVRATARDLPSPKPKKTAVKKTAVKKTAAKKAPTKTPKRSP